jgi:hypothetical protein
MNINDIDKLKDGMWVRTKTGLIAKVKFIDNRFPLAQSVKFPIIYTDDNKTCWSCDAIEEYGWDEIKS